MTRIKAITNASIVLEGGIIWDGCLVIKDGKISEAGYKNKVTIPEDAEIIDARGLYVGPGFVDIHVHGSLDARLFHQPQRIAKYFLKHGETSILPTSSNSFTYDDLMQGINNVKETMRTVKNIKGIYMEGPYINPNYGAARHLDTWNKAPINKKDYIPLVDELGDVVKVWGIAPERDGIKEFIEYARKVNPDVVFSLCHSETTPEQVRKLGTKYRPKLMTHIFNATGCQTGTLSGGIRGYGPNEYCFADHEMYAELISDSQGVHVHSDLQRMVLKNKGIERVVLITDSTPHRFGTTPEEYSNIDDLNFNEVGALAGSRLTLDKACRNIMSHTNCGIAQAFIMASLNPARVIGMDDKLGSIETGKIADLVFVDDKFNVDTVMLEGEICTFEEE